MTALLLTNTPTGQALTKVFHNSSLVNIICLPYCHSIFMLKKFISPAKGEILAPAGKKEVAWLCKNLDNIFLGCF